MLCGLLLPVPGDIQRPRDPGELRHLEPLLPQPLPLLRLGVQGPALAQVASQYQSLYYYYSIDLLRQLKEPVLNYSVGCQASTSLARTKKSLENSFLEKIIIPPQKSIPFNVIKRVQ